MTQAPSSTINDPSSIAGDRPCPDAGDFDCPIVLISSCKDAAHTGDFKYNGGVKLYTVWAKVLRSAGYQTFIVTYDGRHEPWLIEHQPHVSLDTVRRWKAAGIPLRFVTGWIDSSAFIELADEIYFCDCEIAATANELFPVLSRLMESKIRAVATNSRTQQGWYMATFGRRVTLIPEWSDETLWTPDPARRVPGRIGYMREGPCAADEAKHVAARCAEAGVAAELVEVRGDEAEVRDLMRECDVFLGLNPGKDPLWGEGCPRSPQEAMHAGCVVVAYDVHGNREYLIDGYSGFVVPRGRPDLLAERVVELLRAPQLKEQVRSTALELAARAFSSWGRWPLLRDFLELRDVPTEPAAGRELAAMTRAEFAEVLGTTAFIGEDEIAVFAKHARQAEGSLVEIGAGHGASTALMLASMPGTARAYSIDPFVKDSMGELHASAPQCRRNVLRALTAAGKPGMVASWCLHVEPSSDVARRWSEPIGFLYLDGDHTYEAVKGDLEAWSRHVTPGGLILLHDSRREADAPDGVFARGWPGPTRLAHELREHRCVKLVDEAFSLTVWRRTGEACSKCGTR
jgi:hypothetical protein